MGLHSDMSQLIEAAYAAAVEPSRWSDWAWQATQLFGGTCGGLHLVDRSGRIEHQTIRHKDMAVVERYVTDGIGRLDPQVPYAASLRECVVYTDTDHLDPNDPSTAEYVAWVRSKGGMHHYITAVMPQPGGVRLAGLSIHRGAQDGPTSSVDRERMTALLPHIAHAITLGFIHVEKLTDAYWNGLLCRRREPCALLAPGGRVVRVSAAMEGLLSANDGLRYHDGRLVADTAGGGMLARVLAAATEETCLGAGSCRLTRPSGRRPYVVTATPLPRSEGFTMPMQVAALVVIVDPDQQPTMPSDQWRQAFSLSARESEIATLLCEGHSIESAAEWLAISIATARVHLRHLFTKTEVSRQSEMIRFLSRCG